MCVPSLNFIAFIAPEKSVMKIFHLWQTVKPIKGFNSKTYGPMALILVHTIHRLSVHVCTRLQFCNPTVLEKSVTKIFHYWQIVKPIKGCNSKLLAFGPDSGIHNTSAHRPCVYKVSTLQFSYFLKHL